MTTKQAVLSIVIGLCANTLAVAQSVVLLNPPNHESYGISDPDSDRAFAEDFVLQADTAIREVVLWGVRSDPASDDSFTVILHEDESGLPGGVVASASDLVPNSRSFTGQSVGTLPEFVYYLWLPTAIPLGTGTWWIEVFNTTLGPPGSWGWEGGEWDPIHGVPGCAIATEAPGSNWSSSNFQRAILVVGSALPILSDGFESGDTSAWSSAVP